MNVRKGTHKRALAMALCVTGVLSSNASMYVSAAEDQPILLKESVESPVTGAEEVLPLLVQNTQQDPLENVALKKTAVASSQEADSVKASNAFDGDTTSRSSRWGSEKGAGPEWIYVDLGEVKDVKTIKIFWENRKATKYSVQIAESLGETEDQTQWITVKSGTRPAGKNERIVLEQVERARYVRLYIDSFTAEDPDGGVTWNTVSIYEMEVYGGVPKVEYTMDQVLEEIQVAQPAKGDTKLNVTLPEAEGFDVAYNGTNLEQIVGDDLTIYQPVVDKEVKVSFKVTDTKTNDFRFKEVPVTIPGTHQVEAQDNQMPSTLPVIQEWKGTTGNFTVADGARIIYADAALKDVADATAKDYQIITGKTVSVVSGDASMAQAGDLVLSLNTGRMKELLDEGYSMTVDQVVKVEAAAPAGAYYATRTLLQSIKKDGNVPCGIARDYPEYQVRGFMLDVGRKTFSMDFLKDIVQQMAWYKMNDLQLHLNDNYIWLEELQDPMSAYSGFRLESNIVKGGNNGLNQADLTSKDVFYTKDEFRQLIKESRTYGVDIVPEIDVPAHSLALTKVRPDLRHGTRGRENDHLNLANKYEESLEFVQSIFGEYMFDENNQADQAVFDQNTTVHIGADEYEADKEAYRHFADDMLAYVQNTGRTARIWGSLTQINGSTPVRGENVQMQLWNANWADMKQMYTQGFDLINCDDRDFYIVPNAGYYGDYLKDDNLYNKEVNTIRNYTVPAGDDQMAGGAIAVWNDMIHVKNNGVSEHDVYQRLSNAIPLFGTKLWGKGDKTLETANQERLVLKDAPQTNFNYEVPSKTEAIAHYTMNDMKDTSGNGYDLAETKNAAMEAVDGRQALKLNGGESYVDTSLPTVGLGNDLRVKVKRTSDKKDEQILFESAYGTIKAVQKETGKVGFSREGKDYSFNYELPVNEWAELEFKNELNTISLYVNGKQVDILGDGDEKVANRPLLATCMFPVSRIGSSTKSFEGYVDDVRVGKNDTFYTTVELDRVVGVAQKLLETEENQALADKAVEAKAVIDQYAPEEAVIAQMISEINELMKNMDYKKADYTKVDKYLNLVPEDLTLFTPDSVKPLEAALAAVQKDLPAAMQDTVDGYETALKNALAGLTLKEAQDVEYVEPDTMKATASSYQKDGSDPDKVLDNSLDTMWHTDWNITTMPHWIDLEMDKPTAVDGLTYVPRQNNSNGRATKYRIEKSDNGKDYTEVISGNWPDSNDTKEIKFDSVTTKHIRLVIVEAGNRNGSAVEIRLHAARTAADVDGLNQLIAKADNLKKEDYTQDSWSAMQDVLKSAKEAAAVQNPTVDDIEAAKKNLEKAIASLALADVVPTPTPTAAPTEAPTPTAVPTEAPTPTAAPTDEPIGPTATPTVVPTAAPTDEPIGPTATPTTVPTATPTPTTVPTATPTVVPTEKPDHTVDKEQLEKAYKDAVSVENKDYPKEKWEAFQAAMQAAEKVLADKNATQEEVHAAMTALTEAMDALNTATPTKVPTVAPTKVPTVVPTKVPTVRPTQVVTPKPTSRPSNGGVQTGDPTSVIGSLGSLMGAAALGGFAFRRKKKKDK